MCYITLYVNNKKKNSIESQLYDIEIKHILYIPPFDLYRGPSLFLRLPIFRTRKTMTMTKTAMMTARMTPMITAAMFNESLSASVVCSSGPESSVCREFRVKPVS